MKDIYLYEDCSVLKNLLNIKSEKYSKYVTEDYKPKKHEYKA